MSASARSLESFRKEAKRWLKELRAHDAAARARMVSALGSVPEDPSLRDVQHALAREHGYGGWSALKDAVAAGAGAQSTPQITHEQRVAWFLEQACLDWRVMGVRRRHAHAAADRILNAHPEIAHENIFTAIVTGTLNDVQRCLAAYPGIVNEAGGPRSWRPLLYLCNARISHPAATENAVAIAGALLDAGADPNAFYPGGHETIRYTALTSVIAEGEEEAAPHPKRNELVKLLLERGAEPYDMQVFYNTHFHGNVLWYLELIYAETMKRGRAADWADPDWKMIGMGGLGWGARFLLGTAVRNNDLTLARWILQHGASANPDPSDHPRAPKRSLYEEAIMRGYAEMGELLRRHGAPPVHPTLTTEQELSAVSVRLNAAEIRDFVTRHPEHLSSWIPIFAAARGDRVDIVAMLLDLGVPIEVTDKSGNRPLHVAASHDAVQTAQLLIERGADIDPVERDWSNTPFGFAVYGGHQRMIDLLSAYSRDVWNLTITGKVERLREVLAAEPALARVVNENNATPLMWLPDDEARALEAVELLLEHGADPQVRRKDGMTASEIARRRGMELVAGLLVR